MPVMTENTRECSECGGAVATAVLKEGDRVKIIDGGPLKIREGQLGTATGKAAPTLKMISYVMEQKYEVLCHL